FFLFLTSILLIPALIITVRQSQDIRKKAYETTPESSVLALNVQNGPAIKNITFSINTPQAVDGIQFVAYLDYQSPDNLVFNLPETAINNPGSPGLSIITNTIEHEPANNRYKITLSAITQNPQQPFPTDHLLNKPIQIGNIHLFFDNITKTSTATLSFDSTITKVISHSTGENLAGNLPTLKITFQPTPTPTPSISPTPTSTISATPTSLPTPTIIPAETTTKLYLNLEGTHPNGLPNLTTTLYNQAGNIIKPVGPVGLGWNQQTNSVQFIASYNLPRNTINQPLYTFIIKSSKHLGKAFQTSLIPNRENIIDRTETLILTGDANNDNLIDLEDYHILTTTFNPTLHQPNAQADFNYDGYVNIKDYQLLVKNFAPGQPGDTFNSTNNKTPPVTKPTKTIGKPITVTPIPTKYPK
ncbi:hypothetical protein KKG65_01520, partial [Patescibacteria group bacterium]|nr:hypothetical protein [Patescibacteria group bacterium]